MLKYAVLVVKNMILKDCRIVLHIYKSLFVLPVKPAGMYTINIII
jgi:hypothetical protein